jgi:ceramide glucosyltransferase
VRERGLRVYLAPFLVDTVVSETNLGDLLKRERRWALTIRSLAPTGFIGTFVTHPLAFAVLANILSECRTSAAVMLACTVVCRIASARAVNVLLNVPAAPIWLLPLRDGLSFWIFVSSFLSRTVAWRGQRLRVGRHGDQIHGGR